MCETMSALVCDTSLLKATDYRLKKKSYSHKICTRCELGCVEDIKHLVMQCPAFSNQMNDLFEKLLQMDNEIAGRVAHDPGNYFKIIMGMQPEYASFDLMVEIWLLTGDTISKIYRNASKGRV